MVGIDMLVKAYHSIIDKEYEKYRPKEDLSEVRLSKEEILKIIKSAIFVSEKDAENVLEELVKRKFLIALDDGTYRSIYFDVAFRISNITIKYGTLRYPLEAKIIVRDEELPKFDEVPFEKLKDVVNEEVYKILEGSLSKVAGREKIKGFSFFQFNAISSILNGEKKAYVLTAGTSAGKTFAFLFPILMRILQKKLKNEKDGITAILIYPRKSLERDQLNKIISIIHKINIFLKVALKLDKEITIGIDDGTTPWKDKIYTGDSFRGVVCPACGIRGEEGGELEFMKSNEEVIIRCSHCGTRFKWIYGYREEIWEKKPDILITNFWTLDFRLPSKTIRSDYKLFENVEIVVLDEAHVYQSLLGGNIRYLIKRLKLAAKKEPLIILSSATIGMPKKFASNILDMDENEFEVIYPSKSDKKKKVIYLILAINPQRSWETFIYELAIFLSTISYYVGLKSVIFIDSIREIYRILKQLKVAVLYFREPKDHFNRTIVPTSKDPYAFWHYADSFDLTTPNKILEKIGIHHSGIPERELIEKEFSSGRLGVLISTSTLELGVDYPDVAVVTTVGLPFMIESIPQRIGRAGRKAEKTLNTILGIIVLRNTPIELYYMYNPEELIEGFKKKEIPISWKNFAIKKYHTLFTVVDKMAESGENTFILKTDGRLEDSNLFIQEIQEYLEKIENELRILESKSEEDLVGLSEVIEDIKKELSLLPKQADELKKLSSSFQVSTEIFSSLKDCISRVMKLAKKENQEELLKLSHELVERLKVLPI